MKGLSAAIGAAVIGFERTCTATTGRRRSR